jgi:hypothetical protein
MNASENSNDSNQVEYEFSLIKKIIDTTGPRIPCSEEEKRGAEFVASEFEKISGNPAIIEEFTTAPYGSIGMIPILGYLMLFVILPLYYLFTPLSLALNSLLIFLAVIQIFLYLTWFDRFFPQGISRNVYTIIPARSGHPKKTILLTAHIDSSWDCPVFEKKPHLARYKLIYGVVSVFILLLLSTVKLSATHPMLLLIIDLVPIALIPGYYFLARYISYDKKKASPGAMDNLSGIALNCGIVKDIVEGKISIHQDIQLILVAFGAEEAALKGSQNFVKRHKGDLLQNALVINVDSISDYDDIHIVVGDDWLGTVYDEELKIIAENAMKKVGVKYDFIKNPAGGTDSASFSRAKIKTITLAAQDGTPKNVYHTFNDTIEHLNPKTMLVMKRVVQEMINEIGSNL